MFSFEYLWPETVFIYGVLDEFVRLSSGSLCYLRQEGAERLFYNPETKDELLDRLPDDIAFVCYFRNLIINALQRTIDEKRFKKNVRLRKEKPILLPYRRKFCLTTQIMMHWKMVSMNLQEYAVYHIMKSN